LQFKSKNPASRGVFLVCRTAAFGRKQPLDPEIA
jgi:hypothetical protein